MSAILWVLCFYFTLSFFENLHKGEERVMKQSKIAAVICIALALMLPMAYSLFN